MRLSDQLFSAARTSAETIMPIRVPRFPVIPFAPVRTQTRSARTSASAFSLPPKPKGRSRRWPRRLALVVAVGAVGYGYDRTLNASAVTRSLRTGYIGLLCALDYKLNFAPSKAEQIEALHERVANRLRWVIDTNQGLYLKLGQALGLQAALLPKPYREAFSHVFDKAPSVGYDEVIGVFQKDLGITPDDVFETFTHTPLASASIAQVHKARLKPGNHGEAEGKEVAVKVQKPAIEKQMDWDLFSYRSLMWVMEKWFELPMYFVAKYVSEQMRHEVSFTNEAANARRCAQLLAQTPELTDDVYIPRVFGKAEGCVESERIMVMEWIDGCRLNDQKALDKMGLDKKEVMNLAITLNSAMTFSWGFVHCDPHPGNILVRKHPTKRGKPQIVLIDHGLYIELPKQFREDYATLWRSLFVLDVPKIESIAQKWGIALDANMFASAILLRPSQVRKDRYKRHEPKVVEEKSQYEQQVELKKRLKTMLENEQLIPRELIFLGRCQRMMQANNQMLGSPSSRVNLTAEWASKGYLSSISSPRTIQNVGLFPWLKDRLDSVVFRITLGLFNIAFAAQQLRQWFKPKNKRIGWEDELQKQFETMAKEEFGIEIDDQVFLG